VARRDRQDTQRALAPTVVPPGAIVIDSSDLSSDEVVERLIHEVKRVAAAERE
jgi:cytidylate kinase